MVDPGIGFAKDIDGNLSLLDGADTLRQSCDNLPFLYGLVVRGLLGRFWGGQTRRIEISDDCCLLGFNSK